LGTRKSTLLRGGGISCDIALMNVPLTVEIHRDGEWFVAFCPEVPEANGQGRTQQECLASLREAILLLMEDRREDAR
jgi:predicted RNase H-like HicB family nuclease